MLKIGIIPLAWSAFPGSSVSRIYGIFKILEVILGFLTIPTGIIPSSRINSWNSFFPIRIIQILQINSESWINPNWNY